MSTEKRLECRVYGRVQMVLFRDFTKRSAEKLGLVGTVWNESDGSVGVIAEGNEEKLKKLLSFLRKGPTLANVKDVKEEWLEPRGEFSNFDVNYYA